MPLFGAAYAAPNKDTTILYCFRSQKQVLNPPVNGKIQGLFKFFLCVFQVLFKANLISRTFQASPVNSSTFQACANPDYGYFCPLLIIFANRSGFKQFDTQTVIMKKFEKINEAEIFYYIPVNNFSVMSGQVFQG